MTTDDHAAALDAIRARFDERAASYDDIAMHRELATVVAGFCDLDGVARVLDVATGTGLLLRALRRRPEAAGLDLLGVDLSPRMLDVARAELPGVALVEGDASRLPMADGSVDLLTCVTAVHLLQQPATAFADWARVLAPTGRVVLATFNRRPRRTRRGPIGYPSHHESYETTQQIGDAFAHTGLTVSRHTTWTHAEGTDDEIGALITELRRRPAQAGTTWASGPGNTSPS